MLNCRRPKPCPYIPSRWCLVWLIALFSYRRDPATEPRQPTEPATPRLFVQVFEFQRNRFIKIKRNAPCTTSEILRFSGTHTTLEHKTITNSKQKPPETIFRGKNQLSKKKKAVATTITEQKSLTKKLIYFWLFIKLWGAKQQDFV